MLPAGTAAESRREGPPAPIWEAVDELVERAPTLGDLRAHGLQLLAARRCREVGLPIADELLREERLAAAVGLGATVALEQARSAYDGTMLVIKGPEVAARYPETRLRPFRDVDLLVDRPAAAHAALIAAGFEPVGPADSYYDGRHHLRPLVLPGHPVFVELHRRVPWMEWTSPPSVEELFARAVPSAAGVEGILAPHPAHHALLVSAHSWSSVPLRRILDLVDAWLLATEADPRLVREVSRRWRIEGLWRTTEAAAATVLFGRPALSFPARLWARDLIQVRERTVFANHVRRLAGPFAALPPRRALPLAARALWREFRPVDGESRATKAARSSRALTNAFRGVSAHDRAIRGRS